MASPLKDRLLGRRRPARTEILAAARRALAAGDVDEARRLAHQVAGNADAGPDGLRARALVMLATIERLTRSRARALTYAEEALRLDPGLREARLEAGFALIWLGRMNDAERVLGALSVDAPLDIGVWRALGYARIWTAGIEAADACFARAHALHPSTVVPVRVSEDDFDARVMREWDAIPSEFRAYLGGRAIQVRTAPLPTESAVEAGQYPLLQGYFDGLTPSIVVFQRMVELGCPDTHALQVNVRRVVRHEVGHALGMHEHEVRGLGL